MHDFKTIVSTVDRGVCSTLHHLIDSETAVYREGQLDELNQFFNQHGFNDLEFVGKGSSAVVVAPKNNPSIVIRISEYAPQDRDVHPYMLQPIGKPIRVATYEAEGKIWGGYNIEFVKRLDMKVAPESLGKFLQDIQPAGYRGMSLARGSEIGWYEIQGKDGNNMRVLMGADPSSLGTIETQKERFLLQGHPTLIDQYQENLRLAESDPRLHFLKYDITEQINVSLNDTRWPRIAAIETLEEITNGKALVRAKNLNSWQENVESALSPNIHKKLLFGAGAVILLGAITYGAMKWRQQNNADNQPQL